MRRICALSTDVVLHAICRHFRVEVHMTPNIVEFPHHGDHLETDDKQAEWTMSLLAAFVIITILLFILSFAP